MSPTKFAPTVTESSFLGELVDSVQNDAAPVAAGIKTRVASSQQGEEVVMMGGWTN